MSAKDKITIAPNVLLTIARLATLGVEGVARMGNTPGGIGRLFRRAPSANGVQMVVNDQTVVVDIYIIIEPDVNVREVCHQVQREVTRAIEEMVGMEVLAVNVHVEDVAFRVNQG